MISNANKKILRLAASGAVSIGAGYLALRGVRLEQVAAELLGVKISLLVAAVGCNVGAQVLRSYRWGVLLAPVHSVGQRVLLPVTCVGFLMVWILPARIGEMARPYLLDRNSPVGLSAAAGSVVLERLLDASFLVLLLLVCVPALPVPAWLTNSFQAFVGMLLAVIVLLALGSLPGSRRLLERTMVWLLPANVAAAGARVTARFYSGMAAVINTRTLLGAFGLTLVIWGSGVVGNKLVMQAMGLPLGWEAAVTVLVFSSLGIAVPAAPGFIGSFHYATVIALLAFGAGKEAALAYAVLLHFLIVLVVLGLGVASLNLAPMNYGLRPWRWRRDQEA